MHKSQNAGTVLPLILLFEFSASEDDNIFSLNVSPLVASNVFVVALLS